MPYRTGNIFGLNQIGGGGEGAGQLWEFELQIIRTFFSQKLSDRLLINSISTCWYVIDVGYLLKKYYRLTLKNLVKGCLFPKNEMF